MNQPSRSNVLTLPSEQEQANAASVPAAVRKPQKRMRLKWRNLLLFGILAWAGYTFFFVQMPDLDRLETEQARLTQELEQMKQTNQDLQQKIELLHDPDYIAETARKKYMMVKEGETLFVESKQ